MKWLLTGLTTLTILAFSTVPLFAPTHGGIGRAPTFRGTQHMASPAVRSHGFNSGGAMVTRPFVGVNPRFRRDFDRGSQFRSAPNRRPSVRVNPGFRRDFDRDNHFRSFRDRRPFLGVNPRFRRGFDRDDQFQFFGSFGFNPGYYPQYNSPYCTPYYAPYYCPPGTYYCPESGLCLSFQW